MNVVLVGTGNVAFVLSQLLAEAGHTIIEVSGRNTMRLQQVSWLTGAKFKTNFSEIDKSADVCLITVSDSAIAEVAKQLNTQKTLVIHTSGASSKEMLNRFANYGVLYPLQSLRKETKQIPVIPFLIDANTKENIDRLYELASSTNNTVTVADDKTRLQFHVAAVLCSNFTNHLYALTEAFCRDENINFKNLLPLIQETVARLPYFPAAQMQTGPAIRNDEITIQRHLDVLQSYPDISHIYKLLTASIQKFYLPHQ